MEKIIIQDSEYDLPDSIEQIDTDLYLIDFNSLFVSENEDDWFNPRRLGGNGNDFNGLGFDHDRMNQLVHSIKVMGLVHPLICRWGIKDGNVAVEILDGERRWRCIERMVIKDDKCWSARDKQYLSAGEVYKKIPCKVFSGNVKEAYKIAFHVSDNSVAWGDVATIRLVSKFRKWGCDDEEILRITGKKESWLKETDILCELDPTTLNYLLDCKINRALALRLAKIDSIPKRIALLEACYEDAVLERESVISDAEDAYDRAIDQEEIAESELEEELESGDTDEDTIRSLTESVEDRKQKTEEKKGKLEDAKNAPQQAKNRNFNRVIKNRNDSIGLAKMLTKKKIEKQKSEIQELMKNEGKDQGGKLVAPVEVLAGIDATYDAILGGHEDIISILKRRKDIQSILQKRAN